MGVRGDFDYAFLDFFLCLIELFAFLFLVKVGIFWNKLRTVRSCNTLLQRLLCRFSVDEGRSPGFLFRFLFLRGMFKGLCKIVSGFLFPLLGSA